MITERIDRVTTIPPTHLRSDPPAPRSIKIELTARCNYRCSFCALATRTVPPQDMDFDLFARIAREAREVGVEEFGVFYLGESFCAPDLLVRAIRFLKRDLAAPYVFLTTNGSLASPERAHAVMEAGLDSLKWSINAADGEQFARVTNAKPVLLSASLANLKRAREIRDAGAYACRLYASSIQYDDAQQMKMAALLTDRVRPFVDEFYWLPLYSMATAATSRERDLGYRPTAGNQGRVGALRDPLPCWACFTEAHVTSRGKLSACCFDADDRFEMADLNKVSFAEGWRSAAFQTLREAHLRRDVKGTVCEGCVAYR